MAVKLRNEISTLIQTYFKLSCRPTVYEIFYPTLTPCSAYTLWGSDRCTYLRTWSRCHRKVKLIFQTGICHWLKTTKNAVFSLRNFSLRPALKSPCDYNKFPGKVACCEVGRSMPICTLYRISVPQFRIHCLLAHNNGLIYIF